MIQTFQKGLYEIKDNTFTSSEKCDKIKDLVFIITATFKITFNIRLSKIPKMKIKECSIDYYF